MIPIDDIVDGWSSERWEVAHRRAEHQLGMERDLDDPEYIEVLKAVIAKMVMDTWTAEWIEEGHIEAVGVNPETGEVEYSPTEKGLAWQERER